MPQRSYRWLFVALAASGLAADLASKYAVFGRLYPGPGRFHGEWDVFPGWFKLTAEFDPRAEPCDCAIRPLQTWSGPVLPRVNHGALFGLGGEHKGLANRVFAGISLAAAVGIAGWAARSRLTDGWLAAALGLILGGTAGNLFDRVVFNGVRDFLYFYHPIHLPPVYDSDSGWPVFNLADCCLVVGAGMLLAHAFLFPPAEAREGPRVDR